MCCLWVDRNTTLLSSFHYDCAGDTLMRLRKWKVSSGDRRQTSTRLKPRISTSGKAATVSQPCRSYPRNLSRAPGSRRVLDMMRGDRRSAEGSKVGGRFGGKSKTVMWGFER
jgi:hypothetical protein